MKKIILILFITTLFVQSSFFAHSKFEVAENEEIKSIETESILVRLNSPEFLLNVPQTGRYQVSIWGNLDDSTAVWIEDYINNKDERTYNITGSIILNEVGKGVIDGSPLAKGEHQMKLHSEGESTIDSIRFDLIQHHLETDSALVQNMSGSGWSLVWSDEFNGAGLADDSKWIYNVGNWGWGNNELQYYTSADLKNARQENGSLIIEAHKNEKDKYWSSARLTTQSKVSFKYGRIEFRAKVPAGRGTWAAGWLLGDTYQDELSWPYCGEIDVLECVGYEINDTTGYGINHATCHTRAYYFKQGNQIGSEIEVDSMHNKFHTYAVEWYPTKIEGYLDGELYYTYDKNADSLEWPFNQPQNIIINLAIGGGWGGKKGIDSSYTSHQYILDYVRVYEKK
ncbi:glycoside hydrolase family 16 protein [Vicingaceae bacterium]|nr:glycoside hydrolase family 16 protein [Vicingaceae bacterium]MDB4061140.1 glycoside hydrolase family 16 protein [Vicingaceae bacterium]MDC1451331.1 glycoside hydrolase family 16 protein [Vicingaceae bacterium]